MTVGRSHLPGRLLSALLVVGAGLFVIGAVAEPRALANEKSSTEAAPAAASTEATATTVHVETGNEEGEAGHTDEVTAEQGSPETTLAEGESGHTDEVTAEGGHQATAGEAGHVDAAGGEKVLGLRIESPGVVALGVAASVAFAALAWWRRSRVLLMGIAVFATLFTVLDIAEVRHQVNESRTGIAILAAATALAHVAAALVAARDATPSGASPDSPAPTV